MNDLEDEEYNRDEILKAIEEFLIENHGKTIRVNNVSFIYNTNGNPVHYVTELDYNDYDREFLKSIGVKME